MEIAKQEMERELMKELEKRREERLNEEKRREVCSGLIIMLRMRKKEIFFTL